MSENLNTDSKENTSIDIDSIQSPIYDLFPKEMEDISTDSLQYIEYYDVNLNGIDTVSDFRLEIRDIENWHLLNKSFVDVQFKVTNANGANFAANENIALANNAVGLFSRWELKFDSDIVEFVDEAHITNNVQSLVYFTDEYSSSIAKNQFWFPDTVDSALIEPAVFNSITSLETVNYGHRKRKNLLNNSNIISVQIPLKNVFGLLKSMTNVTKGIKYELRLTRNIDRNILFGDIRQPGGLVAVDPNGRVSVSRVSWWVPRVKPNVSVLKTLEPKLNKDGNNIFIPYIDTQIYKSNPITEVANNKLFQIKVKRKRPIKCFIVFQNVARSNGDQTTLKTVYDNIELSTLRVVLNATTQYPEREFTPKFSATNNDYARVYNELIKSGLKDHDIDQGSPVNFENFKTLFPIFCVDMSQQAEFNVRPDSALIDVYWSASNHPANYFVWVIVEAERKLHITTSKGHMKYMQID